MGCTGSGIPANVKRIWVLRTTEGARHRCQMGWPAQATGLAFAENVTAGTRSAGNTAKLTSKDVLRKTHVSLSIEIREEKKRFLSMRYVFLYLYCVPFFPVTSIWNHAASTGSATRAHNSAFVNLDGQERNVTAKTSRTRVLNQTLVAWYAAATVHAHATVLAYVARLLVAGKVNNTRISWCTIGSRLLIPPQVIFSIHLFFCSKLDFKKSLAWFHWSVCQLRLYWSKLCCRGKNRNVPITFLCLIC